MRSRSIHLRHRTGVSMPIIIVSVIILLIAGIGIYSWMKSGPTGVSFDPITAEVTQGDFVAKVLDQGEIESSANVEIRCEVKARNGEISVLKAAPEGILVKPGDFLVQLDSASFDKELDEQNIAIASAKTTVIKAETTLETAKASKREYEEGVFVEALQTIENEIFDADSEIATAKQELEQSIAVMEHSEKLHSRGFITQRQLNADVFAVEKAKIAIKKAENLLSLAKQKKKVLVEVTQEKQLTQLDAEIRAAKVDLESEEQSFAVEQQKLADINEAIAKCRIVSPPGVKGQLVYAKEERRGDDWVLEEGTAVRENQVLVRVPDPSKMQVKALINEQSITQIEPNMPAIVQVDALNDVSLKGIVVKVNQYAESKGWLGSNIRKYAVFVRILDPPLTLKPGMNASVSIQSRHQTDAIMAPLQTVYSIQDRSFCLVKNGDDYETREVKIDGDNSRMVMFKEGVKVGDQLVMNPGAYKDRMELPEVLADQSIELPDNVTLVKADATNDRRQSGAEEGKAGGPGGQNRGGGKGRSASGMVDGMMAKYDSNSDGTIDAAEIKSLEGRAKDFVGGADANSDGQVTKAELTKTATKMMSQRRGGGGGGPRGGGKPGVTSAEGSSGSQP